MISIGDCTITSKLYESHRTIIYRGKCDKSGTPVVLKILNKEYPGPEEIARFKREYEITRHLKEINGVISVYNLETYKNSQAMILEDVDGESLTRTLSFRKFSVREFLRLAIRIAGILEEIHQQHVMHKDINPSNIIWNPEVDLIKIIDFGISTMSSEEQPEVFDPNILEGTLAYMSPEQTGRMNRAVDYRTDFYSLGITFYEMLLGFLPFQTDDKMELVHCHLAKPPQSPHLLNHDIPKPVSDIIMKLLAKTAEDRYQSAPGLASDLQKCLEQLEFTGSIQYVAIGQDDVSERFQIPQRLYGRTKEIESLLAAFDRASQGQSELMLVSGFSGIGKSALVHELHKPIIERRGYFISGEFEQFKSNVPYSALIQALQMLTRQILTESETQISLWKERFLSVLGPNVQVMLEIIPDLELIIGKQPKMPALSPVEVQQRLYLVLQIFLQVLHSPEYPLVIFLDNLQWADTVSLRLAQLPLTAPDSQALLIIGAYRDHELNPEHPLQITLNELQETEALVNQICLMALSLADITHLLSDTLHYPKEEVVSLAELVLEKTRGNPLAVREFLKSIYTEELLWFNADNRRWHWNPEQIRGMTVTENVVDFMTTKIQRLPVDTQQILQYAACIGNRFDLHTLASTLEKTETTTAAGLDIAVKEGLILPTDDTFQYMIYFNAAELKEFAPHVTYDFAHNRFQEAVAALISKEERKQLHLKIGRHLLRSKVHQRLQDEGMAEVVNHLNLGVDFIDSEDERIELARLNLITGQQAKAATTYSSALEYFTTGMALLENNSWKKYYELTLDLYTERAEVEYLAGNFKRSEQLFALILKKAHTPIEKAGVCKLLIAQYSLQARYEEAIRAAKAALRVLGIELPKYDLFFEKELAEVKECLAEKEISSLIHESLMTDPAKKVAMQVLDTIIPTAFQSDRSLYRMIIIKMINLSLMYGNAPESAAGYAHYGALLGAVRGQYATGYEFGLMAVKLSEQFGNPAQMCKTTLSLAGELTPWVKHIKYTHKLEHEAYHTALDAGEPESAGFTLMLRMMNLFYEGTNLHQILKDSPEFLDFSKNTHNQAATDVMTGCQQIIHNLCGLTPETLSFDTDSMSEAQYLAECQKHHSAIAQCVYQIMKVQVLYLYGSFPDAMRCALEAKKLIDFVSGFIARAGHNFYFSLNLAAIFPTVSKERQKRYFKKLTENQQQMKIWAENCPENFRHTYLLVQAERSRLTDDPFAAMQFYQQALEAAKANEFIQHKALAHELAAKFYLERGFDEFAEMHFKKAYHDYTLWGAVCKATDLAEGYPQFLVNISSKSQQSESQTITDSSTGVVLRTTDQGLSMLDLTTVMKASQAMSGKIVLAELLEQMMNIVIENAGAQKGWLILKKKEEWVIEAERAVDNGGVKVLQSIPLGSAGTMQTSPLPTAIIQYVIRTAEPVLLRDAVQEGNFTHDPYIEKHRIKSVLCMPLLKRGKLGGVVYLENNLTTGAFTPDRLEMLKLTSAQMIISIENATLYKQLNGALKHQIELSNKQVALTNAYSRFVPSEFLSLLEKKSIIDVQLGDQIEKEITVMFSDIRGFTPMSEQMTPQQNFNFINSYLRQMSPIIREHNGFIDKYIGDAIMALFPTNADDAVKCSIAMIKKLKEYNQGRKRAGYKPVQIGIGLNTGLLMLGTVGDQYRMDGTVISDAVNLAARIEGMTKKYGVSLLISETTYFQLEKLSDYSIRIIDQVQAKGKSEPVTVFEVFNGDVPQIIESKLKTLVLFKQGFKLYHRTKFAEAQALFTEVLEVNPEDKKKQIADAKELFEEVLHVNPHDKVAQIYIKRCEQFLKHGVPEDWSGVWAWVDALKKK